MAPPLTVHDRVEQVRARIASAGRRPDDVAIVAATKGFGPNAVEAAAAAGLRDCGENYAQELLVKAAVTEAAGVRWHFMGAVQRNKVAALAGHVTLWQAVDRTAAAAEIARRAPGARVLVQVNLSGDPSRPGCGWGEAPALVEVASDLGLKVEGLMGVAGRDGARAQFRRLAVLANRLGLAEVSMGMSGDFEVAIAMGATHVRVGSAIFGARPMPAP